MSLTPGPNTSTFEAEVSTPTDPPGNDIARLYEKLNLETLHFGYWSDEADTSSLEEASEHLTDLVLERLTLTGRERVLDVGCGDGAPALRLAGTTDASVLGITISAQQVAEATRRAEQAGLADQLEFQLADAMAMPFPDDSFDAAFALESVHHMDRPTVLRELARVVRPGGKIVLADIFRRAPAPADGPPVLDLLAPMWMMTPPCALADYPGLLRDAGLHQVELNDISDNVLRSTFTVVLDRIVEAVETGTAGSLPSNGEMDLTVAANQEAVIDFTRQMCGSNEVGYVLLVADAPQRVADN